MADDELDYIPELAADTEEDEATDEIVLDPDPETEADPREEMMRLRIEMEEIRRERDESRRAAPSERTEALRPRDVPSVSSPARPMFDPQKFAEKYNQNPLEALSEFAQHIDRATEERVRSARAPLAVQQTRSEIDRFRRSARLDEDEAKIFDAMVDAIPDSALADADPASVKTQLEVVRHAAIGKAYDERRRAPVKRAPSYSASSYGSAPSKERQVYRVNSVESQFIKDCERQGLSKKDALEIIRDNPEQFGRKK